MVERAIAADYHRALAVLHIGLRMLVNAGGGERTDAEYDAHFAAAGFPLSSIVPLGGAGQFSVFECVPA